MKKEGSTLPSDLHEVQRLIWEYYEEFAYEEDNNFNESLKEEFRHATIRVKLDKNSSNYKRDIDKLDNLCRAHKAKGRLAFSDTYVITIYDEDNEQTLKQKAKDMIWYIDRNIDSLTGYSNDSILKEDTIKQNGK